MMRIQQINWNLDSVSWKTQHPTPDIADLSIPKCQVHLLRIYLLQQTWDSFSFHLWVTSKWFPAFKKGTTLFFHFWNYINYSSSISFGPSPCFSPTICPKFEMQNSQNARAWWKVHYYGRFEVGLLVCCHCPSKPKTTNGKSCSWMWDVVADKNMWKKVGLEWNHEPRHQGNI